jgi:(p)ppGpp synthase/HD superfamily hydrolase
MTSREQHALEFAKHWHDSIGQVRKYSGKPYWHHCVAVAEIVKSVPHTADMVDASLLHDVLEDTPCKEDTLCMQFGIDVFDLVKWLTNVSKPSDGNREKRKAIDRAHIALAPRKAKTVKLADLIDNSRDIILYDPEFARVFLKETRQLLDESLIGGDFYLWAMADEIVRTNL